MCFSPQLFKNVETILSLQAIGKYTTGYSFVGYTCTYIATHMHPWYFDIYVKVIFVFVSHMVMIIVYKWFKS